MKIIPATKDSSAFIQLSPEDEERINKLAESFLRSSFEVLVPKVDSQLAPPVSDPQAPERHLNLSTDLTPYDFDFYYISTGSTVTTSNNFFETLETNKNFFENSSATPVEEPSEPVRILMDNPRFDVPDKEDLWYTLYELLVTRRNHEAVSLMEELDPELLDETDDEIDISPTELES